MRLCKGAWHILRRTADYRFILVVSCAVIGYEYRDEKADDHPYAYHPCIGGDRSLGYFHAVASHLRGDDPLEDEPISDWQRDIGAFESEGEGAGDLTAVNFEVVE